LKKFIGFGDFILRLNPPGYLRFSQADSFMINYTGAEANVCVSLSCMGIETDFVTKLPDNDIARCGVACLRKFGVGTSKIVYGGERMGVFYLEKGAAQRPSKVIYDRKFTAICNATLQDFNWNDIFKDAGFFHITGITPALGENVAEICLNACKIAKENGLTISCDLNYRKNLWSQTKAKETMEKILRYVDVLIANEEDAEKVLDIKAENTDVTAGHLNYNSYVDVAKQICDTYKIDTVAITLRKSISASDNEWAAMFYTEGQAYFSKNYKVHIVDRVGGGDSFAAGLIYGIGNGFTSQKIVEYAAAASCLKHSIELDFNLSTVEEINRLMEGDSTGRVQR
jgi:2-dehydro-3-deoxygluconokinase